MSIDDFSMLSAEDAALFETAVNRRRAWLDRESLLFIAMLIAISMLAGFCGGLPLALASHQTLQTESCAYKTQAASAGTAEKLYPHRPARLTG